MLVKFVIDNDLQNVINFLREIPEDYSSKNYYYALHKSVEIKYIDITSALLECTYFQDTNAFSSIIPTAICTNNFEALTLLLNDVRVNPNAQRSYALKIACERNCIQSLKLLSEHKKINLCVENNYVIKKSIIQENEEVTEFLFLNKEVREMLKKSPEYQISYTELYQKYFNKKLKAFK